MGAVGFGGSFAPVCGEALDKIWYNQSIASGSHYPSIGKKYNKWGDILYTMKQACTMTGLSYETLKFYCNEGLVPNVKRDAANHRVFDDRDIRWINSLTCLKNCGMGIQEMKTYLELCLQGRETIPERKELLRRKREELEGELARVQESITYIDHKQTLYDDILAGRAEYHSNLIST